MDCFWQTEIEIGECDDNQNTKSEKVGNFSMQHSRFSCPFTTPQHFFHFVSFFHFQTAYVHGFLEGLTQSVDDIFSISHLIREKHISARNAKH